jgi:DNA polymerase I-like protein with 3'-5' exonuclease and polymerase domains
LRRIHQAKKGIKARLDYDGKMRTSINIVGTETGRRTTGILDPPVRPDKLGFPFQLISKYGDFGTDVRYMYVPKKGMIFQNFDLSQAEARIVANLCNDEEMLKLFDTIDIHALTASWVFGGKYEDHIKKEGIEPVTRFGGKTIRHAGNYNMGKRRLVIDVTAKARRFHIDISLSESQAEKCLTAFHKNSPRIREVFHRDIRKAITDNKRVLTNPYGRRRIFLDQMGEDLYREAYAQIPQSTVGDHTAGALIRIKKRIPWLEIILESHDAILVQNYESQSDEVRGVVKEEFEREIDFSRCSLKRNSLKIPCDCEVGYNYKDMRKFKYV